MNQTDSILLAVPEPIQQGAADDPLWYKDSIIYQLHVKAFFDSNDDGIGDFRGLIEKLDYIQELGVSAIWLLPFYPSPQRDDGYDIADYHHINPDYGVMADFKQLVREAHKRNLKVITELVVNHTSDQHPWFQAARRAPPGSSKRNYYVWSDSDKKYAGTRIIFTDTEKSNWTWDPEAKAFFWHRFFSHQPDLNFDNPHVLKAIIRTMRYWLDLGVDGFRLDAIPYLCEREGTNNENLPETHDVVKRIRAVIDAHYQGRLLLAEANQWPEDVRDYFGDGDECHMAYHFPLMPRMYMAIAQEDRHPIIEIMRQTPEIPATSQWAIFLRNHDELTLEMVTSKERDYMYQTYAADARARINLGIRRRLAPLMGNDIDKIKLMNSLLLSMPGSPILYYGDEIGMGDNVYLGDRNGVRTPMQWNPERNAGFSHADPQRLFLPPIMDPVYGYQAVNVEAQSRDPSSLLNWTRRLLAVRKGHKVFGRGKLRFLRAGNRKILAYLREYEDESILCVANLARSAQPVELDLAEYKGRMPVELMGRAVFPPVGDLPYLLTLPGHSFYWFRLAKGEEMPAWHEERLAKEELPVLVLFDGWRSFFRDRVVPWRISLAEKVRVQLEREVLPQFMMTQRWYAAKTETLQRAALTDHVEWEEGRGNWLVALFQAETESGGQPVYFMPMTLMWENDTEEHLRRLAPVTMARVRQQAQVGVLGDAFGDDQFCRAMVAAMSERRELRCAHGTLRFSPTQAFAELAGPSFNTLPVRMPGAQSSNTIVVMDERLFLKGYRRLQTGVNPEAEIGRFLTEVVHFQHSVPVAGMLEYAADDGSVMTLALLQGYVENQGDGWNYTKDYLVHYFELSETHNKPAERRSAGAEFEEHGAYFQLVRMLGRRTAELHVALATKTGNPAFEPEPIEANDIAAWVKQVREEAIAVMDRLEGRRGALAEAVRGDAEVLLQRRQALLERIEACAPRQVRGLKIRHHGDYHLGQVLLKQNDFILTDFEGEPGRTFAERRQKHSPLRDVAGMLRSFNYAMHTALLHVSELHPDMLASLEVRGHKWESGVQEAFLGAYRETAEASGLYSSWEDVRGLLELFLLEKAFYELRYEIDNRPDWVRIPLRGITGLAGWAV